MSVSFILGRSGTGKTKYCIDQIIEALEDMGDCSSLALLVPEQATYQMEQAIVSSGRIKGFHRLHIISFDRLTYMLTPTGRTLSRCGREMAIASVISESRDKLEVFRTTADREGMASKLADIVSELHQYAHGPADVLETAESLRAEGSELAARKFSDIAVILQAYLDFIESHDLVNPDYQLSEAINAVARCEWLKGAKLWIDGFSDFTVQEQLMLEALLRRASQSSIALCLDPVRLNRDLSSPIEPEPASLFMPTERTYNQLVSKIIPAASEEIAEPVILKKVYRFEQSQVLGHIEKHLFDSHQPSIIQADNSIRIISASNARAEAEFAAREICRLVREHSYRYRDIAVVASDLEEYQHYLAAVFGDYNLPYFIDRRRPLRQHPLAELVCSALDAGVNDLATEDVFNYLKTGLAGVSDEQVDLLENYCLAYGITGRDLLREQPWRFGPGRAGQFDQAQIDSIRKKAVKELAELRNSLSSEQLTASDFASLILELLNNLNVSEKLGNFEQHNSSADSRNVQDADNQFAAQLRAILDEMILVFGDKVFEPAKIVSVFQNAVSQVTLAFIPPAVDQVLIGSIERSRHPDLKAVFLLGTTGKNFPAAVRSDSLLTDFDRDAAIQTGFELGDTAARKIQARQYLAYIAFTRACERLYITCPAADEKDSPVQRSQFVDQLCRVLSGLQEQFFTGQIDDPEKIFSSADLADYLCLNCGADRNPLADEPEKDNDSKQLLAAMSDKADLQEAVSLVKYSLGYDNTARLEGDVVQKFYSVRIEFSDTRLESFASCPYQHFAKYLLRLREREEDIFQTMDLGAFYHELLKEAMLVIQQQEVDFADADEQYIADAVDLAMETVLSRTDSVLRYAEHSAHSEYVINNAPEIITNTLTAYSQMCAAGSFRPVMFEKKFGFGRQSDFKLVIDIACDRELYLKGIIDRVDSGPEDGGAKPAVVFDYKIRNRTFKWAYFDHALDLQLPIYLLAIQAAGFEPVGGFYLPITVAPKTDADPEKAAKKFSYKAGGICNGQYVSQIDSTLQSGWSHFYKFAITKGEGPYGYRNSSSSLKPGEFEHLLEQTREKIKQLTAEIFSAKIDVQPYRLNSKSPCSWCVYRSLCRFDWQVNSYRLLESSSKTQILDKAGESQ